MVTRNALKYSLKLKLKINIKIKYGTQTYKRNLQRKQQPTKMFEEFVNRHTIALYHLRLAEVGIMAYFRD